MNNYIDTQSMCLCVHLQVHRHMFFTILKLEHIAASAWALHSVQNVGMGCDAGGQGRQDIAGSEIGLCSS